MIEALKTYKIDDTLTKFTCQIHVAKLDGSHVTYIATSCYLSMDEMVLAINKEAAPCIVYDWQQTKVTDSTVSRDKIGSLPLKSKSDVHKSMSCVNIIQFSPHILHDYNTKIALKWRFPCICGWPVLFIADNKLCWIKSAGRPYHLIDTFYTKVRHWNQSG